MVNVVECLVSRVPSIYGVVVRVVAHCSIYTLYTGRGSRSQMGQLVTTIHCSGSSEGDEVCKIYLYFMWIFICLARTRFPWTVLKGQTLHFNNSASSECKCFLCLVRADLYTVWKSQKSHFSFVIWSAWWTVLLWADKWPLVVAW